MEIRGNTETDFRSFFLLVKNNSEIRRDPILKDITAKSLFLLRETNFLASSNHFLLHFSETLGSDSFFPSIGKVFF